MNREILEKPFTPEQIKRRQGTNGDVLDYIEGCAVIQRLNECFDAEWIFEIQEHRVYDDEVVVLGKLTAQGVAKNQFGKSRITRAKKDNSSISLGDDLKAAATDCLKKCATLFGVGLHLYFDVPPAGNGNANGYANGSSHGSGNGEHRSNGSNGAEGTGSENGRLTARQLLGDLCCGQGERLVEQAGSRLLAGDAWKASGLPQQEGSICGHPASARSPK